MNNDTATPAATRDVWLSIALAVARDGLPEPRGLGLHDHIVSLSLQTHEDVRKWAGHLGLGECEINGGPNGDGSLWAPYYERDGWSWQVSCHQPAQSPTPASSLAEQVAAAILTPDAVAGVK